MNNVHIILLKRSENQLRTILQAKVLVTHRLAYTTQREASITGIAFDPNDGYRATHTKLQGKTKGRTVCYD